MPNTSNVSLSALLCNASCQDNSSDNEPEQTEENPAQVLSTLMIVLLTIAGLLIIAINGLVIYLIYVKKALRSPTNLFLTSLAFLDFTTGLVGVPLVVHCLAKEVLSVCVFSTIFIRLAAISSVCHIILIAFDRYIAIVHPLQHGSLVTKWRAAGAILFVWLMSFGASIIQLSWYTLDENTLKEYAEETATSDLKYIKACIVVFFAIPLLMICYMYGHIFYISFKSMKTDRVRKSSLRQPNRPLLHEWRGRSVLLIMVVIFAGCWLPFFLAMLQDHKPSLEFSLRSVWVQRLLVALTFVPPLLNPLLCTLAKKDFRRSLMEVAFRERFLRQREERAYFQKSSVNNV